jgi:hypothetical protein
LPRSSPGPGLSWPPAPPDQPAVVHACEGHTAYTRINLTRQGGVQRGPATR